MAEWLKESMYPLCRTASELILLFYLVYGWDGARPRSIGTGRGQETGRRTARRGHILTLLLLYGTGAAIRYAEFCGIQTERSGLKLTFLFMLAVFYFVLVFYMKMNRRLAFFYAVVFAIPADLGDLLVFIVLVRGLGISMSRQPLHMGTMLLYVGASFLLRFLMLAGIRRFLEKDDRRTLSALQLLLIALSVLPFVYMRNLGFWLPLASDDIGNVTVLVLVVTGVIALILVIGNERIIYYHIQQGELLKMQHMMHRQHEQYEMRREAVDLVNQKYHDMRHQLIALLGMEDIGQMHAYVNTLREEIVPFELFFHTGNPMLDIILSDKAEECEKKKIRLLPMADGTALSMLEAADLCTIFGNALDNAIEGCEKVGKKSCRVITLKVCQMQGFLVICVENPYVRPPRIEAGRLISTKLDPQNHGYGLQGIRQAAERYEGTVDTQMEEGIFTLTLLLPLKQ